MSFFWSRARVLNRLSTDTNDVDLVMPQSMQWFIMTLVRVLGILVIISYVLGLAVRAAPLMVMYAAIREYYRATSVGVQRIESVLRSPVFSHLSETVAGTTTLRAFLVARCGLACLAQLPRLLRNAGRADLALDAA
jgi:hypothetical protein